MTVILFPVSTSCSGRTIPDLTPTELRKRAVANFYSDERRKGVDIVTAYDRSEAFGRDLEVIAAIMKDGK